MSKQIIKSTKEQKQILEIINSIKDLSIEDMLKTLEHLPFIKNN